MPSLCKDPAEQWAGARCCKDDGSGESYCGSPEVACALLTYDEAAAGCASLGDSWRLCTEAQGGTSCSSKCIKSWRHTCPRRRSRVP